MARISKRLVVFWKDATLFHHSDSFDTLPLKKTTGLLIARNKDGIILKNTVTRSISKKSKDKQFVFTRLLPEKHNFFLIPRGMIERSGKT